MARPNTNPELVASPPDGTGDVERDSPATASDRASELVTLARDGDVEAWARLYQDHFDRLFRDVTYLTGKAGVAEDLVQETFARALASLGTFDGRSTFATWLRGIAVNVVGKHWRSRARRSRAYAQFEAQRPPPQLAEDAAPAQDHLKRQRARVLLAVLETLPPHLREAFVMCDLQQRSVAETAAHLKISPGNLRVRAHRARARIREQLVDLGWILEEGAKS